jgi:hypothetical protein
VRLRFGCQFKLFQPTFRNHRFHPIQRDIAPLRFDVPVEGRKIRHPRGISFRQFLLDVPINQRSQRQPHQCPLWSVRVNLQKKSLHGLSRSSCGWILARCSHRDVAANPLARLLPLLARWVRSPTQVRVHLDSAIPAGAATRCRVEATLKSWPFFSSARRARVSRTPQNTNLAASWRIRGPMSLVGRPKAEAPVVCGSRHWAGAARPGHGFEANAVAVATL